MGHPLRPVDWSDATCPLCHSRIYRLCVNKWEDDTSTEQCRCSECFNEILVERDANGAIESVGID